MTGRLRNDRKAGGCWASRRAVRRDDKAPPVLILLKCLFFLGIVFVALSLRDSGPSAGRPRVAAQATASTRRVDEARSAIAGLADRAVDGLTEAARDHCLSHPLECLHAAERLQGGKTEAAKR
jgi:hypothetical protein